jgi:hypothetical protein
MAETAHSHGSACFRILSVTQGQWGDRIADNIHRNLPTGWEVERWKAPPALPLIIDDPADFLPSRLPQADLILALGETPAVAQLIPDIVRLAGATAVIAPIDRNESLPAGLLRQLRGWLEAAGVAVAFPKPFCSLTEDSYNLPPIVERYDNAVIREFARHFGRPRLTVSIDPSQRVSLALVNRDSACGCAHHVAHGLGGLPIAGAEHEAGMLHHHYPCLASMNQDADYNDTLMHVSGHLIRQAVRAEIKDFLEPTVYLRPHGRVEPGTEENQGWQP